MWDGKLGLWPIGHWAPAQRSSVNRPAGTMVWQDESVTKEVYRRLLLEKVFPAIKEAWPRGDWQRPNLIIRVQQDGAPTHIDPDDVLLMQGLQELNMENKVLLYTQPANSPDCNINDLGFFRALQSLYQRGDQPQQMSRMFRRHTKTTTTERSIGSGLAYSVALTRSSTTMVTTITS